MVVNWALSCLYGESIEITITDPVTIIEIKIIFKILEQACEAVTV